MIAPLVMPSLVAAFVFLLGPFLIDDDANPIGIILIPIFLLTVGLCLSYLLMLAIGMPIAFHLHRRNWLSCATIHLAALILSVVGGLGLMAIGALVAIANDDPSAPSLDVGEFFAAWLGMGFVCGVFVIPTATVFWLVACWRREIQAG